MISYSSLSSTIIVLFFFKEGIIAADLVLAYMGFVVLPIIPISFNTACKITYPIGQAITVGVMIFLEAIFTPALAIISAKILEIDLNGTFYLYISLCALACLLVIPLKIPETQKQASPNETDQSVSIQ